MNKIAAAALMVGVLAPSMAWADQPLQTTVGNSTTQPAIAYNSNADEYMVVYRTSYGRLEGQIRDATGEVIDDFLEILPHFSGLDYHEPRLTYRPAQDLYLMTTVRQDNSLIIPTIRLSVTAFDAEGALEWTHDVPWVANTVETPDIVSDTFPSTCCALVTWKEGYGTVYGQQIDASGTLSGPKSEIYRDTGRFSDHAFNPRIAYQRAGDFFLVVYQRSDGGAPAAIEVRRVNPVSGTMGTMRHVATMDASPRTSYGEDFPGGPDIAWDATSSRFVIAFRDEASLSAARLDASGALLGGVFDLFQESDAAWNWLQPGVPEVTVADGTGRFLVSHARRLGITSTSNLHWIHGWWVQQSGAPTETTVSTWWYAEQARTPVGAYSPVVESAFVAWERDEPSPFSPAPVDLYFELKPAP